jgi:cell division septation protein DedD
MKGSKKKSNSFLTGKKKALLIIAGSLASVALFFLIAQSIEVFIRTTSTVPPKKSLPFAEPPQSVQNRTSTTASRGTTSPPKLSFYKTLVQKEKVHEPLAKSKTAPPINSGKTQAAPENKHPAERTVPDTPSEKDTYVLQLGAFQKSEKARFLIEELQKKGYAPYTVTQDMPGRGILIKVRIGGFKDLTAAQHKAAEIEKSLKVPVLITQQ